MSTAVVVGSVLLALLPEGRPPDPSDLRAYEAARARAGRDAEAHVRLALWCERRGLDAERVKHLAVAVLIDPKHAAARGLMGLVSHAGRWEDPAKVGERVKADEALAARLAEYNARRDVLGEQFGGQGSRRSRAEAARAHVQLGMWCEQNGLKAEATAHFTSAVVLDPYRETTWKHLGYVKHHGRWASPEQVAEERREARAQRDADQTWGPLLKKWRGWLADVDKRAEARERLSGVTDPYAVPAILRVFRDGSAADQQIAAEMLAAIDTPASTRGLVTLAVSGATDPVRSAAVAALRGREPRDFVPLLVDLIRAPIRYQVEPVRGPGSPGALAIETARFRMLRTYEAPPPFRLSWQFYGYVGYDSNGLPIVAEGAKLRSLARESPVDQARDLARIEQRTAEMLATAQAKALASQQRLVADVAALEAMNGQAAELNARIIPVLRLTADAPDLKDDEDGWHVWWYDRLGYRYEAPPKVTVTVDASPQPPPPYVMSCFVAGTPVRTLEGRRPIETLRVGDRVLGQDVATGALSFETVLVVHHNPPGATVRVELDDGEVVEPSIYHRFWRAGRGWAMARELRAGDVVRTLGGLARVASASPGAVAPLYNLDVAGGRTFFVGRRDALVHDNTLPDARTKPFDREPELAAVAPRAE